MASNYNSKRETVYVNTFKSCWASLTVSGCWIVAEIWWNKSVKERRRTVIISYNSKRPVILLPSSLSLALVPSVSPPQTFFLFFLFQLRLLHSFLLYCSYTSWYHTLQRILQLPDNFLLARLSAFIIFHGCLGSRVIPVPPSETLDFGCCCKD